MTGKKGPPGRSKKSRPKKAYWCDHCGKGPFSGHLALIQHLKDAHAGEDIKMPPKEKGPE